MKHINKYYKFIKLNEDTFIDKDIDKYNIDLIKDSLIELEDLGMKIESIINFDIINDGYLITLSNKTSKMTENIRCECKFNKTKIYKKIIYMLYKGISYTYTLNKYEKNVINAIKDRSILLLNMLDYTKGEFSLDYNMLAKTYNIYIHLYKNKTK